MEQDEESPVKKKIRKIYLVIIALFLILVWVMNSSLGIHLFNFFSGTLVSSTLQEDTFMLNNGKQVVFEAQVYETLKTHYLDNQDVEIKACLIGSKDNDTYHVAGMYIPRIYQQNVHSVTAALCNASTIVSLHSHPYLRCLFSQQDLRSYEAFRQINPEGIIALMCDTDRLTFFGHKG